MTELNDQRASQAIAVLLVEVDAPIVAHAFSPPCGTVRHFHTSRFQRAELSGRSHLTTNLEVAFGIDVTDGLLEDASDFAIQKLTFGVDSMHFELAEQTIGNPLPTS
jgi:hypothetical protein